jgi:hypothetical protein
VFRTTTTSRTDRAKEATSNGAVKVTDSAAELKVKAAEAATVTAAGAAAAKVKAADAAEAARETAEVARVKALEAAEVAREKAHEAAETIAPKVEHARDTFVEDVLPKVASAVAAIAAGAAAAKETAVETADRAPDAYAVLKGDAVAKSSGGKGRWILLLGALAAGAAVMAWRKSNERPDPWASAGTYTPPKSTAEKVSDAAGAAKAKAADVKDTVVEKAAELKGKATDAKDAGTTSAGAGADVGDGDTTDTDQAETTDTPDAVWADANVSEAAIPSTTGTSEGSDLSTPNIDGGADDTRS